MDNVIFDIDNVNLLWGAWRLIQNLLLIGLATFMVLIILNRRQEDRGIKQKQMKRYVLMSTVFVTWMLGYAAFNYYFFKSNFEPFSENELREITSEYISKPTGPLNIWTFEFTSGHYKLAGDLIVSDELKRLTSHLSPGRSYRILLHPEKDEIRKIIGPVNQVPNKYR